MANQWNMPECVACGKPTRFLVNGVPVCKDDHAIPVTAELPRSESPRSKPLAKRASAEIQPDVVPTEPAAAAADSPKGDK